MLASSASSRLNRLPPPNGGFNERVLITDKVISPQDDITEQFFINIQSERFWASINQLLPATFSDYVNEVDKNANDTGIWLKTNDTYLPEIDHSIYYQYRKNGRMIDYVFKVNKIGQEFYDKGYVYLICRTDIRFDVRLKALNKPQPSYIPFN